TIGPLDAAVRSGRPLYAGISSDSAADTARAAQIADDLGTPLLIHQPSYSMLNRWIEDDGLLDTTIEHGLGVIAFSPLAQGLLTDRYLGGVPEDSRAGKDTPSFKDGFLSEDNLARIHGLGEIAAARGQSLAQMALAWALRDPRVSSLVIGASRVDQLE
ncbi:aldo/keto reductase, partial [Burkholderia multivorans]